MILNENNSLPYMKSMSACLEKMVANGYTDDFKAVENGLQSLKNDKVYLPEEVTVDNFYRFEGNSDPDDMSILYAITTNDGTKGTLIDAYGTYASPEVNEFMLSVEKINKKVNDNDCSVKKNPQD